MTKEVNRNEGFGSKEIASAAIRLALSTDRAEENIFKQNI